jgi:hypothetical protein
MMVSTFVRKYIWNLPLGKIFSRRELVDYGPHWAIDQALKRLKDTGQVAHLACGMYVRPDPQKGYPTCEEVAIARIEALQRFGTKSSKQEAADHGLIEEGELELTYEVNASTSQFWVRRTPDREGCIVRLISKTARKMKLSASKVGRAIKAIWYMGHSESTKENIRIATKDWGRTEKQEFYRSHRAMPGWLSNEIHAVISPRWHKGESDSAAA